MPLDDYNEKMVLTVQDVRVSLFKDANPDDSDEQEDIGLSSEEEGEGLEEFPHIRRKYHQRATASAPPPPPPGPPPPPPQPQSEPEPGPSVSTASVGTSTEATSTIEVPTAALKQVHTILGQILGGENSESMENPLPQPEPQPQSSSIPFAVPKPKRGKKVCQLCKRTFWQTETLKRHLKTHTGEQKHVCPNPGCGRKLSSKRGLEVHLTTCQKDKSFFCSHKNCDKLFATKEGLAAHKKTHKKIPGKEGGTCTGCGKKGFTKQKSLDDHYRTCAGNPNRVGPFPCTVPGCRRGPAKPFTRVRNLNVHLKGKHGHDPKHS